MNEIKKMRSVKFYLIHSFTLYY